MWLCRLDPLGVLLLAQPDGMSFGSSIFKISSKRPMKSTILQNCISSHRQKHPKYFSHTENLSTWNYDSRAMTNMTRQRGTLCRRCQGLIINSHTNYHRVAPQGWWAMFALRKQQYGHFYTRRPKTFNNRIQFSEAGGRPVVGWTAQKPLGIGCTTPKAPLALGWSRPTSPLKICWKQ
jgi:hypothetical protein